MGPDAERGVSMKTLRWLLPALVLCTQLAGCPYEEYRIELRDRQGELERTLVYVEHGRSAATQPAPDQPATPVPSKEAERLATLYPERPAPGPGDGVRHAFRGRFKQDMPNDVGNHGTYAHYPSRLGWVSAYAERFRGSDDPAGGMQQAHKNVDRLVELIAQWLGKELAGKPEAAKLQRFVREDLRRDLQNLRLYAWLFGNRERLIVGSAADEKAGAQPADEDDKPPLALGRMLTREQAQNVIAMNAISLAAQYLVERKYVLPSEAPSLVRALKNEDEKAILALLETVLRRKAGLENKDIFKALLDLLGNPDRAKASWGAFLMTTPEYARLVQEHQKDNERIRREGGTPNEQPPEPAQVAENLLSGAVPPLLQIAADVLKVTLHVEGKLIYANGEHDPAKMQVTWSGKLGDEEGENNEPVTVLPVVCAAAWGKADEKYQKEHFGRVAITDQALLEYCLWRQALPDKRAREWDAYVDKLRPGPALAKAAAEFRFSGPLPPPATQPADDPDVEMARKLLKLAAGLEQ